jgi:predicted transcriptional regulator
MTPSANGQLTTHHDYGALFNTVKQAVEIVPEEFTRKDIMTAMKEMTAKDWNPASTSNCLKRLVQDGTIEEVSRGRGSRLSVFLRKNKTVNDDSEKGP